MTTENKNLEIWNKGRTPDSKYVKAFNKSGFKGSAINPTWVAQKLTEIFGPAGQGWGFNVLDEKYVEGGPTKNNPEITTIIHVIRGQLWTRNEGEVTKEFGPEQYGQTTFVGAYSSGPFTDEEAPKKSVTDCLTKCASLLGIGADIHLGLWDDNKYVAQAVAAQNQQIPIAPAVEVKPASDKEIDALMTLIKESEFPNDRLSKAVEMAAAAYGPQGVTEAHKLSQAGILWITKTIAASVKKETKDKV